MALVITTGVDAGEVNDDVHNKDPKPFLWRRTADQILESIARYAQRTLAAQPSQLKHWLRECRALLLSLGVQIPILLLLLQTPLE